MLSNNGYGVKDKLLLVMTHDEIEQYLKDKDLNTFEYQLVMDAMLFAEQKTIEKACEWLNNELFEDKQHFNIYYDNNVKSVSYDTLDQFMENFKKAMEL